MIVSCSSKQELSEIPSEYLRTFCLRNWDGGIFKVSLSENTVTESTKEQGYSWEITKFDILKKFAKGDIRLIIYAQRKPGSYMKYYFLKKDNLFLVSISEATEVNPDLSVDDSSIEWIGSKALEFEICD